MFGDRARCLLLHGGGPMRRMRGFTLLELLAVLLILGVLLAIGVPSMQALSARTRADSAIFGLRAMLGLARQSAITLNRDITVCGTVDGVRCSAEWREIGRAHV